MTGDPLSPRQAAFRVRRTVGFLDLSGFTTFSNENGDDAAVEQLAIFRSIVRHTGAGGGVRVAKWLGDGAMFGGSDAAAVIAVLLRVIYRVQAKGLLEVHGGVTTGDVIFFEGDDYIGSCVNKASRLADCAEPGQLLGPVSILPGLAGSRAVIGTIDLPGFDRPVEVADLCKATQLVESLNL